ncbi:MAG: hypothetical protein ACP5XB_03145 [Isosphaeraceae bacterium]
MPFRRSPSTDHAGVERVAHLTKTGGWPGLTVQDPRPSIVLRDEIKDSLHLFAHDVLLDAISAASEEFPVVISTHNPEILSHASASGERIRIVQWNEGTSRIHHLSKTVISNLKPPQTVGRLLRSNALWTEDEPSEALGDASFFDAW